MGRAIAKFDLKGGLRALVASSGRTGDPIGIGCHALEFPRFNLEAFLDIQGDFQLREHSLYYSLMLH